MDFLRVSYFGGAPGGPPGAESLRGERPFLFLRKKKRSFIPKKKMGPVYGESAVVHGGGRLSYDRKDPSRPLRPALGEQGQADALTPRRLRVPLSRPGWWGASLAAERETCCTLPREWHSQAAAG